MVTFVLYIVSTVGNLMGLTQGVEGAPGSWYIK